MGITIEKLEGKEGIMKLLDMLAGGDSDRTKEFREAKARMMAAGFSGNAMAALGEFTAQIDGLASALAVAVTTAENNQSRDAAEFAFAALKWMEIGLDNCHTMLEKSNVDPNLFGLRKRSEGYSEFLRSRGQELRRQVREHTEFVAKDTLGNAMKLTSATEGEAAAEALSNLGYTLSVTRK